MDYGIVVSMTGIEVRETVIESAANKAIKAMLSELQEEAQTYDVLMYIVRRTKEKIKGARITIRNE